MRAEKIKPVLRQSGKKKFYRNKGRLHPSFLADRVDRGRWLAAVYTGLIGQAPDNGNVPGSEAGDLLIGYRLEQNLEKKMLSCMKLAAKLM